MLTSEIFEAASQKLFHFTYLNSALNILKTKKFYLTSSMANSDERKFQKKNKFYFLSTTRQKLGDYTTSNISGGFGQVVFNLNGDWFNRRYSASAVDYWGGSLGKDEMEDRIVHDKPEIPLPQDIKDVITEIHVFMNMQDAKKSKKLRQLIMIAKQNKIPVYYYNNDKAFLLQNKSKAFDIKKMIEFFKETPPDDLYSYRSRYRRDYLTPYRELYFKNKLDDLSKDARTKAYNISFGSMYKDDVVRSLDADMHNMKSGKDETDRKSLYKLLQIFKKEGYTSPRDFIDAMSEKWREIYEAN